MKFRNMFLAAAVIVVGMSAVAAKADGIDPRVTPSRGSTGSPVFLPALSLPVTSSLQVDEYTVGAGGVVTSISITLPAADVALGVTCGVSNAFIDGGAYNGTTGFAPVLNANGTATCNYTTFTGITNNEGESVLTLEHDCTSDNESSLISPDFDDCAGVPGGTTNSDVIFTIEGAVARPDA